MSYILYLTYYVLCTCLTNYVLCTMYYVWCIMSSTSLYKNCRRAAIPRVGFCGRVEFPRLKWRSKVGHRCGNFDITPTFQQFKMFQSILNMSRKNTSWMIYWMIYHRLYKTYWIYWIRLLDQHPNFSTPRFSKKNSGPSLPTPSRSPSGATGRRRQF